MIDFSTIDYLKNGNETQIRVFEILTQNKILVSLSEFDPILVGTIPININIENSDLDIICYWQNKENFIEKLHLAFKNKTDFTIKEALINNKESVIASFKIEDFEIEIFGQNTPTKNQNGFKHMIIEHKILEVKDENFRLQIIKLKKNGYKTEPAFGHLLALKGDPYEALLNYMI